MNASRIAFTLPIGVTLGASNIWSVQVANQLAEQGWTPFLLEHVSVGWHPDVDLQVGPGVQTLRCGGARVTEAGVADVEAFARVYAGALPAVVVQNWGRAPYGALAGLARERASALRVIGVGHADSDGYYDDLVHYESIIHLFLAVSDEIAAELARRLPHRAGDIVTRPCAVFAPPDARRPYAAGTAPLRITYAGRITNDQKKMSRIAPLARELDQRGVNFHLRVIGEGGYKDWLRVDVRQLPPALQARISIEPGRKPVEMPAIWRESDVCLLVSDFEGTSVSMLEAMAQGCVPVVTRVSGTGAILKPGINGFVAPPGDLAAMAVQLQQVDQARDHLPAWGQAAHQVIVDHYSYERYLPWFKEQVARVQAMPDRPWPRDRPIYEPPPPAAPVVKTGWRSTVTRLLRRLTGS